MWTLNDLKIALNKEFQGLSSYCYNSVKIDSREVKEGDIFNKAYMETLSQITDELFYLPGVDRSAMKSLWTPNVRWVEVTEEGHTKSPAEVEPVLENHEHPQELILLDMVFQFQETQIQP